MMNFPIYGLSHNPAMFQTTTQDPIEFPSRDGEIPRWKFPGFIHRDLRAASRHPPCDIRPSKDGLGHHRCDGLCTSTFAVANLGTEMDLGRSENGSKQDTKWIYMDLKTRPSAILAEFMSIFHAFSPCKTERCVFLSVSEEIWTPRDLPHFAGFLGFGNGSSILNGLDKKQPFWSSLSSFPL